MITLRSLIPVAAALALAGCSQSQGQVMAGERGRQAGYPARVALGSADQPLEAAPLQPEGGIWQIAPASLAFGLPGQAPLLAISCQRDARGATALHFVRVTRAEPGAKALFALIGNGRIARLPLNVLQAGDAGRWEGVVPAADPRLDVLRGGNGIEATLPGGGTLKLPASRAPGELLATCRASDTAPDQSATAA